MKNSFRVKNTHDPKFIDFVFFCLPKYMDKYFEISKIESIQTCMKNAKNS